MVWTPFGTTQVVRRNDVEIGPEEIFMDSVNTPGFHSELAEGRIERSLGRNAFLFFGVFIGVGLAVIAGRLVWLELVRGGEFLAQAQANRTKSILIAAPRGVFYDRNFEALVENSPTFVVSLVPSRLSSDEEFTSVLAEASRLLGRTIEEIADANGVVLDDSRPGSVRRADWPEGVFLAAGDLRSAVLEFHARPEAFPGIEVTEAGRRDYPLGWTASHLLGYVGRPSREALAAESGIRPTDIIGKAGLEAWHEAVLQGRAGEKLIEVNAEGEVQRERFIVKPTPGRDVVLEIDARAQQFSADTLRRHLAALGKRAGAIVMIDPRDGAVRALVSYPSFDSNLFGRAANRQDVERLLGDPTRPFFNRAISGGYPSGSTVKPMLAVAALEEGVIDPDRQIYDPGYISVPNPYDPANPTIFKDWSALGMVNMRRAIAMSANVYFYTIGGGYRDIAGLGIERMKQWLARFGWGSALGIDLPGEYAGLVPDPEKKKATRPNDPVWRIGDTYITSIGQGDTQVTPLQLAVSIAAIANGGTLWQPRLARAIVDEERQVEREFRPHAIATGLARAESLEVVREGMRQAVTAGSASALADLFFPVAGKTGTAQTGVYGKNHGWFVGFAPYENPEVVIAVLVEEGTGGSTDAVPIAKEVLYHYFTEASRPQLTPLENSQTIGNARSRSQPPGYSTAWGRQKYSLTGLTEGSGSL
ncbi:MAG: penicillin-binding protein 2 [Patescibacteria group bacterium]